jgi:nitrogen fixation/metabolism regulation signal transduction histidine kinase
MSERNTRSASASERFFLEAVVETSPHGILAVDDDREFVTYNREFVEMWDIPPEVAAAGDDEAALEAVLDSLDRPDEFLETVAHFYEHPDEEGRDRIHLSDGRVFDRYTAPVTDDGGDYCGRVWFFRDVTDRVERRRELEAKNERLERFAGIVSHDLRNPLTVAEGRLELLEDEVESEEHLAAISRAHERMRRLVEGLLTLAREGDIEREPVDVGAVAERCWADIDEGGARVAVETSRTVRADRTRLRQLLDNLLRNAVEHGATGGRSDADSEGLAVTVGDLDGGFYVADDGVGLPDWDGERLFERGHASDDGGTGLGLAIVARVADDHGWTVEADESDGGGARFEIRGVEGDADRE